MNDNVPLIRLGLCAEVRSDAFMAAIGRATILRAAGDEEWMETLQRVEDAARFAGAGDPSELNKIARYAITEWKAWIAEVRNGSKRAPA